MNEPRDFARIPAGACVLHVGEFELGDNGDGAKTAPVRLVARTGEAIEHWFWGRVVHDLAGMRLHKQRIPIDYVHDSKEIVGYLNKFDTDTGDLVTSGALVPFRANDRATEIAHKMRAGVPYEASINFGGDGIKVEEIGAGMVAQVNGRQFDGPGIIIREWPLRGVAICPYGADANTESSAMASANAGTHKAAVITAPEPATKEIVMEDKPVEVAAQADTPAAAEQPVEATPEEAALAAVEPETPEGQPEPAPMDRAEFARIADEFGAEIAVDVVRNGGDYAAALRMAFDAAKRDNETLRARVAELEASAKGNGRAVPVSVQKPKQGLFKTGK